MEQQFSLSWNNFHGNLSKGFAGLLGNGEFVDVTIAVEGHLVQAHKVILSICSPYFKKMFQLNPCQHPIVVLRDVTHKAMRDLLQFMYHGEVSVKREDLSSFISTAEVLQIKGLTNKNNEEDFREEKDISKLNLETQHLSTDPDTRNSENDNSPTEETTQNNDLELLKQRQFIERLHRFSNLKRKSEEFLQKNFYSPEAFDNEKRQKKDKINNHNNTQNKNFQHFQQMFDECAQEISSSYNAQNKLNLSQNQCSNVENDSKDIALEQTELKTEAEDSDIVVTDPAVYNTNKSFESSRDCHKDRIDAQSPQENCSSLTNLFADLKNLVNGKSDENSRSVFEDMSRGMMEHRLVTIPQKEDGKKKYPQRSCRLCWKIGKRRDTRFMCGACELPFCKSPCFEIHFNHMMKASQLHGYYYAA